MTADPITAPIIASAEDWSLFWKALLRNYDAICVEAHERPPGIVSCWGCFHPVPYDSTLDGFCPDCLMRE